MTGKAALRAVDFRRRYRVFPRYSFARPSCAMRTWPSDLSKIFIFATGKNQLRGLRKDLNVHSPNGNNKRTLAIRMGASGNTATDELLGGELLAGAKPEMVIASPTVAATMIRNHANPAIRHFALFGITIPPNHHWWIYAIFYAVSLCSGRTF